MTEHQWGYEKSIADEVEAQDGAHAVMSVALRRHAELSHEGLAHAGRYQVRVTVRWMKEQHEDESVGVKPLLDASWFERVEAALRAVVEAFEEQTHQTPTELLLHPEVCAFVRQRLDTVEGVPIEQRERWLFHPEAVVVNRSWDEGKSDRLMVYEVDALAELVRAMWPQGYSL